MTREELIKKVALKMDEISSSDDVIVPVNSGDNNPIYTQINNLLNESVNDVLMKAPIYRLHPYIEDYYPSKTNALTIENTFDGIRKVACIAVPNDCIRIVSISDSTYFHRPITSISIEGDDIDKRQHNKHLRAKYAKPVAVLSNSGAGRKIRCYSYENEDTVNPSPKLSYIKQYNNDKDTSTEEAGLDDYMIDVVSWVCAGKVFAIQGDATKNKICDENALALIG